ncbi:LysR family transcriptional regulator [Shewanella sp. 202IG2-18]|uniref:LysR family transcriptional regulator n=1 Tax=Parashewanella hymeniacidonis TaxID=2807618 RepID=UPI0019606718|nr:LysR family transcriptional regulator [Parashewanella hymeniacidonis]MBM7072593.1 LysR family transcriptional regulator [Parashewanella hymeniacidonis]
MEFKQLKTFRTAARTESFSETADILCYVQSAVTAHIKALETELNVKLFDRHGRNVKLTQAGIQLYQYTEQLFNLREQAETAVRSTQSVVGKLNISAYETVLTYRLPPLITEFSKQFPEVNLFVSSLNVRRLSEQVINHQVDIAFTLGHEDIAERFSKFALRKEQIVVIAAPDHPLVTRNSITAEDFKGETILLTEQGCQYRKKFLTALNDVKPVQIKYLEFVSIEAIKSCVSMGLGIAAISRISAQKDIDAGKLTVLDWAGPDLSLTLNMIWSSNRWLSPAVKTFIALSKSRLFKQIEH